MKRTYLLPLLFLFLLLSGHSALNAGEPCCHILICCRGNNDGMTFLVNGQWEARHDYKDLDHVRDILQKIKDAGIHTVIIDMTNPSQWTRFREEYIPMVHNVQQVCREKNMQYFMFIGGALPEQIKRNNNIKKSAFDFWNGIAEEIWNTWAQSPTYRRYGYGDDRPVLLVFQPADMYWERYAAVSAEEKSFLSKFHIGTTQVNDPILPGKSDGWGYRNYSQSVDGKVRFVSPNGGVAPGDPWYRISETSWKERVEWAREAAHYSIYGSYDDTCDAIHWGIADTRNCDVPLKKYPGDQPYLYYNVVKNALNGETAE